MACDKRKGKAIAVEPRKKSKAEKEAKRARVAAAVAERRSRRPDPPFQIREPASGGQEPAHAATVAETEAGAPVPSSEQQPAGPRRSGRARIQVVPAGAPAAAAAETPVRQGPRTRGGRTAHVTPAGRPRPARPTAEEIADERAAARAIYQMDHRVRVEQGT